jgi:hypothetical protein
MWPIEAVPGLAVSTDYGQLNMHAWSQINIDYLQRPEINIFVCSE